MTAYAPDLHRASTAVGAERLDMPTHRATKAGHPLRDEWPDRLDPVGHPIGHPIADCVSAKQREVQSMAGCWDDLASELPLEKVDAAKAVFGQARGVRPFDCAPMQQIVRL